MPLPAFTKKLSLVLEAVTPNPRVSKLTQLASQVATDFACQFKAGEVEADEKYGDIYHFTITNETETVLWFTVHCEPSGLINNYSILAQPVGGQEWDFTDLEPTVSYEDFLGWVDDLEVELPPKDYGIGILNIIAWVINAHNQLSASPQDLDGLFEAGFYKVRCTALPPEGEGQVSFGYWIEATSSDDAKQQIVDMLGERLLDEPKIIQFSKEKQEF